MKLTSVWHKRPQLRGAQAMTMKVYEQNGTLVEVGYSTDAKLGYVLKSCMQAVHVKTSAMGMWPDCHFRDTPPHFACDPGDTAKCFSLVGSRGMGASATVLSVVWEPGGSTS